MFTRDIKPANVFCDDEGNFYLGDFIAIGDTTTGDGEIPAAVTPAYASPELLQHHPVGPTADIYSLGVTVRRSPDRRQPFADSRSDAELVHRQVHEPPRWRPRCEPDCRPLEEVIQRHRQIGDGSVRLGPRVRCRTSDCRRHQGGRIATTGQPTVRARTGAESLQGLRAFGEADAGDFFIAGRSSSTNWLSYFGKTGRMVDCRRPHHACVVCPAGDYHDRPLRDPRIADRVKQSVVVTRSPPTNWPRQSLIPPVGPAQFEDGLVARITADVVDQPGALPAAAVHAGRALRPVLGKPHSPHLRRDREWPERLLPTPRASTTSLTSPREKGTTPFHEACDTRGKTPDTRRRVMQSELDGDSDIAAAIAAYGDSRLLTFDRDGGPLPGPDGARTTPSSIAVAASPDHLGRDLQENSTLSNGASSPKALRCRKRRSQTANQTSRLGRSLAAVGAVAVVALIAGVLAVREAARPMTPETSRKSGEEAEDARDRAEAQTEVETQLELARQAARHELVKDLRDSARLRQMSFERYCSEHRRTRWSQSTQLRSDARSRSCEAAWLDGHFAWHVDEPRRTRCGRDVRTRWSRGSLSCQPVRRRSANRHD
ncbi:hypothetical protein AAFF_G00150150 [Aldrovandia affinis]|uniref:non-specific serine/threonine protein kinase n=1 Tax=Aldrovandia affinis TaxID=143900 RepID=A0AAD7R162_9TELE|nr:hypothetical protein AAFF_G00150150 [Aldrovandia affinis]